MLDQARQEKSSIRCKRLVSVLRAQDKRLVIPVVLTGKWCMGCIQMNQESIVTINLVADFHVHQRSLAAALKIFRLIIELLGHRKDGPFARSKLAILNDVREETTGRSEHLFRRVQDSLVVLMFMTEAYLSGIPAPKYNQFKNWLHAFRRQMVLNILILCGPRASWTTDLVPLSHFVQAAAVIRKSTTQT